MGFNTHETSSLDARELLSLQLGEFNNGEELPIRGLSKQKAFEGLWSYLDIYLQRLEPIRTTVLTKENPVSPLELHSPQYRETRRKLFLQIVRSEGFDIEKLQTIQIDRNGILHLNSKDSSRTINLVERWNSILLPRPSSENILGKSREGMKQLEQTLDSESYFGGSIVLTYVPATAVTIGGLHSVAYTIKQITFRNTTTNRSENILLKDSPVGTKNNLEKNVLKVMENRGYVYDVKNQGFFHPIERTLGETSDVIRKLSYEEYIKDRSTNSITREQFEGIKKVIITKVDIRPSNLTWPQHLENISKSIGKHAGELIFFPVFFHQYSKYQNTLTALQGASEMGLFVAGSRIGARIPAPPLLRPFIPLVAGGAAVVLGDAGIQALDGNKKKWQYLYQDGFGSLYTKGKSYAGHLAGNLGVFNMSEYIDLINKGGTKLDKIMAIDGDDIDIGIPRVEMPLPGKSYLGTIPEITWFQSNISLGTNPWDWLRGAMGRDINDWNQKVGQYGIRLKRAVGDILGKYYRNESMFASSSQKEKYGGKEGVLREHLKDILSGGGDGHAFESEKGALIEAIVMEAKKGNNKTNIETVNQHIDNRVNQMLVDDFFVQERLKALNFRRASFEGILQQISVNSKIQQFLRDIPDRMLQDEKLVADGKWEEYKAPLTGERLKRFIPSEENILFQSLLDDKTEINIDFQGGKVSMQRGRVFAMFLDTILDYKREMEFINEIKKGNKKGVQWNII